MKGTISIQGSHKINNWLHFYLAAPKLRYKLIASLITPMEPSTRYDYGWVPNGQTIDAFSDLP